MTLLKSIGKVAEIHCRSNALSGRHKLRRGKAVAVPQPQSTLLDANRAAVRENVCKARNEIGIKGIGGDLHVKPDWADDHKVIVK